jgi:hypothetical protein
MKVVVLDVRRGGGVEEKRRRTKGVKNGGERETVVLDEGEQDGDIVAGSGQREHWRGKTREECECLAPRREEARE